MRDGSFRFLQALVCVPCVSARTCVLTCVCVRTCVSTHPCAHMRLCARTCACVCAVCVQPSPLRHMPLKRHLDDRLPTCPARRCCRHWPMLVLLPQHGAIAAPKLRLCIRFAAVGLSLHYYVLHVVSLYVIIRGCNPRFVYAGRLSVDVYASCREGMFAALRTRHWHVQSVYCRTKALLHVIVACVVCISRDLCMHVDKALAQRCAKRRCVVSTGAHRPPKAHLAG